MARVLVHVPRGVYRTVNVPQPELDNPDNLAGQCFSLHEAGLQVPELARLLEISEAWAYESLVDARELMRQALQAAGNGWILPPW